MKLEVSHLKSLREQINAQIENGKFVDARKQLLDLKNVLYELRNEQDVDGIVGIEIKKSDLDYYQAWASDVAVDMLTRVQAELQLSQFEAEISNFV